MKLEEADLYTNAHEEILAFEREIAASDKSDRKKILSNLSLAARFQLASRNFGGYDFWEELAQDSDPRVRLQAVESQIDVVNNCNYRRRHDLMNAWSDDTWTKLAQDPDLKLRIIASTFSSRFNERNFNVVDDPKSYVMRAVDEPIVDPYRLESPNRLRWSTFRKVILPDGLRSCIATSDKGEVRTFEEVIRSFDYHKKQVSGGYGTLRDDVPSALQGIQSLLEQADVALPREVVFGLFNKHVPFKIEEYSGQVLGESFTGLLYFPRKEVNRQYTMPTRYIVVSRRNREDFFITNDNVVRFMCHWDSDSLISGEQVTDHYVSDPFRSPALCIKKYYDSTRQVSYRRFTSPKPWECRYGVGSSIPTVDYNHPMGHMVSVERYTQSCKWVEDEHQSGGTLYVVQGGS